MLQVHAMMPGGGGGGAPERSIGARRRSSGASGRSCQATNGSCAPRTYREASSRPHSPAQQQTLKFQEFLATELSALQEKLLLKFESSLPPAVKNGQAQGTPVAQQGHVTVYGSVASSIPEHGNGSCASSTHTDEDVEETVFASPWERMTIRLLKAYAAAHDSEVCDAGDLVTCLPSRSDYSGDELWVPEDLYAPHPVWLEATHISPSFQRSGSFSTFALSRVGEGGLSERLHDDDPRKERVEGFVSQWIVVHPDSILRFTWCLAGLVLLLHDLFTIPMEAANLWDGTQFEGLIIGNIVYWSCDLCFQSLTGYHSQQHTEMRPWKTFIHYAFTWMPLDFAILLLDIAFVVFRFHSTARSIRILRLLRLVRLVRLHKWILTFKSVMRSNSSELLDMLVKVGNLMFILVCLCHFTACAWYGISENSDDTPLWRTRPDSRNWIEENNLSRESRLLCYSVALHWSITQFTPATNNVFPVNGVERIFAIIIVLVGFVAFSAFLSSMMSTLSQLKSLKQSRVRERQQLMQFFRNKRIPAALAHRVLQLFDVEGELKRDSLVEDDLPVLAWLPQSLRIRIRREYCVPLLKTNAILEGMHSLDARCFLQVAYDAMIDRRYNGQQEIFLDGVQSSVAYVVASGKLKYYQRGVITGLSTGEWVSDAALYVQWTHQGSLVAKSCSTMVTLDCDVFRQIVVKTGGDLYRCLRCCAVLFAHQLEQNVAANCLSDLGLWGQEQDDILWRALRFCKCEGHPVMTANDMEGGGGPGHRLKMLLKRVSTLMDSDDDE